MSAAETLDDALTDAGFASRSEAADFFGVDVRTMRRWCDGVETPFSVPASVSYVLAAMARLGMGPLSFISWLDGDL